MCQDRECGLGYSRLDDESAVVIREEEAKPQQKLTGKQPAAGKHNQERVKIVRRSTLQPSEVDSSVATRDLRDDL
jgi:hypothetical protein